MVDATAGPLRGGAVGSVTAALAVAAHGLAGGGYPDGAATALLVAVSIVVGSLTALPRHSTLLLLAALFGGQLVSHAALSIGGMTGAMHHHSLLPSGAMLGFHAAASVVAALLISTAERLYGPITSIVRAVLALLTPLPDGTAVGCVSTAVVRQARGSALLDSVISRRGPPVSQF